MVTTLQAGAFFGQRCSSVTTRWFQFSDLEATVPERQVPKHTHETAHFVLVTEGVYVTEARNQPGLCGAGSLIFNPSGTTHRDCFRSERGKFLTIGIGEEHSWLLNRAVAVPIVITKAERCGRDELEIATSIARELRRPLPLLPLVLDDLVLELIGLVTGLGAHARSRAVPSWLLRVREMIRDGFGENLRMEGLANAAGVHPVYLARAYRRYFGCSPAEHLRRCRLRQVREMLTESDFPLVEIALGCGFTDQSQMTRSFSTRFGISPARYRRPRKQ